MSLLIQLPSFDILTDIIIRDGNCIIKQDWFVRLYEKELSNLNRRLKEFKPQSTMTNQIFPNTEEEIIKSIGHVSARHIGMMRKIIRNIK